MATVFIPSLLRDLTGGHDQVSVEGSTVGEVIEALEKAHPGVKQRLLDGDAMRRGLAVAVDGEVARLGLRKAVLPASEVHFLPAVSGG